MVRTMARSTRPVAPPRPKPPAMLSLDGFTPEGSNRNTREYRDGDIVFEQEDKANGVFYIRTGCVKLTVSSRKGKKAVIGILQEGDFLGLECLTQERRRTATATVIRTSLLTSVKSATVHRLIDEEPAFTRQFVSYLLSRIARIELAHADQILNSSELRLARVLLSLDGLGIHKDRSGDGLSISQGTLAEMVGTTRSRVSFFMNRFREKGLIEYNGFLRVNKSLEILLRES